MNFYWFSYFSEEKENGSQNCKYNKVFETDQGTSCKLDAKFSFACLNNVTSFTNTDSYVFTLISKLFEDKVTNHGIKSSTSHNN